MAGTTTKYEIPFPTGTDKVAEGPAAIQALAEAIEALLPQPGFVQATATATAPAGWLMCDGAEVSRTTYARLFDAIGVEHGAGNGSTTFNVPDLRGRVPVGVDTAGRLNGADQLGESGGAEVHTLITGEIPEHEHLMMPPAYGGQWQVPAAQVGSTGSWTAGLTDPSPGGNGARFGWSGSEGTGAVTGLEETAEAGGGGSHNNMQPYLIVNWLVKT